MPLTLTDDPTQFPVVVVPLSGEARTAEGLQTFAQQLANRTAYLRAKLSGGLQFSRYTTAAALGLAFPSTQLSDGQQAYVDNIGVYEYLAGAVVTADGRNVVLPSDSPASGRWLSNIGVNLGVQYGAVACDSTGRAAAASVRNGTVAVGYGMGASNFTSTSLAFVIPTGASCTLTGLAIGDLIFMDVETTNLTISTGDTMIIGIQCVDPATTHHFVETQADYGPTANGGEEIRIGTVYQVSTAGTHTVSLECKTSSGVGLSIDYPRVRATVYRP
jgi:hypothetical protein